MNADPENDVYLKAVTRQVDRLVKRSRRDRVVQGALGLVIVAVIVVAFLGYRGLHRGQTQTCLAGNTYRAENSQVWDYFIGVLTEDSKNPKTLALAKNVEAHIAKLDAPRHC